MNSGSHRSHTGVTGKVYRALGIFTGTQSLGILCSVVRTKLVALWIGTAGVGLFGLYNAALETLSALSQLGLRSSSVRDLSALTAGSDERLLMEAVVRRCGRLLGLAGMCLTMLLSPLLAAISLGDAGQWWVFAALSPAILLGALTAAAQAVMQADGKLRPLALSSLWGTVASLVASVPLLWFLHLNGIVPVIVVYFLVSYVATAAYSRRTGPLPDVTLGQTLTLGRGFMRLGIYMTVSSVMVWGGTYALMSWLRWQGGEQVLGIYQAGSTLLVRYAGVLFTAIGMEFYPRLAAVSHDCRRMGVYVNHEIGLLMRMAVPMAVVFVLAAPWIVSVLYSSEFSATAPMITAGTLGLLARVAAWCMSYMMIVRGDGRVYMATECVSVLLMLFLNAGGYMLWGTTGLGIAFSAWYLLYLAMVWTVCRHRYGLRITARAATRQAAALAVTTALAVICLAYRY